MRILLLTVLMALTSCKTMGKRKPQQSQLKDFAPTQVLSEQDLINRILLPSEFVSLADDQFKVADEALRRARLVINEEGMAKDKVKGSNDSSAMAQCLAASGGAADDSERFKKCALEAAVPDKAISLVQRAMDSYLTVGYAFTPPVVIADASADLLQQNPSVLTTEAILPPDTYVIKNAVMDGNEVKDTFWTELLDASCQGLLTPLVHALCEEYVLAYHLHSFAAKYLEKSIQASGAESSQSYALFVRYYELAEQKLALLSNYHGRAMIGYSAAMRGIFDPTAIEAVDMVAVVGDRNIFAARISEYYDKYKASVEDELRYRIAAAQTKADGLKTLDEAKIRLKTIEQLEQSNPVTAAEAAAIAKERDALNEQLNKVIETSKVQSEKFVVSFNSVFGKWSAKTRMLEDSSLNLTGVRPNGGTVTIDIPDVVQNGGMIELTANAQIKYRSNGIYFGDLPNLKTGFKVKAPKIKVSCKACEAARNSVKDKVYKPIEKFANNQIEKPVGEFFKQRGNDLANLDKSVFQPMGRQIKADLTTGLAPVMALFGGQAVPGVPTLPVPGALGGLEGLGKNAKSAYPFILEHVYRQTTDVNGYIISSSSGRNVGTSSSTSSSTSTNITVGVNFAVTATVGLGASQGKDNGTSEGASSSLTSQIGFYSQRAKSPDYRVGMLLGRLFNCKNPSTENLIVSIGAANIIRMDPGTACAKMEVFINDDMNGAARECATGFPCASAETIPIRVNFYQDAESIFNGLLNALNSKEFQEVLNSVAFSADPYGSAWNVFSNLVKQRSLTEDPRFRPIVDQYVTQALNAREIERISLEMRKIEVNLSKARLNQQVSQSQIELMRDLVNTNGDLQKISSAIFSMQQNRAEVYQALTEFYASRLAYWLGILRKSVAYHNPDFTMSDFYSDIQIRRKKAIEGTEGGQDVKQAMASFNDVGLEVALDNIKSAAYLEKLLTQTSIGHCFVSLADLGLGTQVLSKLPDPRVQFIARQIKDKNNNTINNPIYDPKLVFSITGGQTAQIDGYYQVNFETDPSVRLNYQDNLAGTAQGSLPLRCGSVDEAIGMDKLIGLGVTYSMQDGVIPQKTGNVIHMAHDSFMFAVKPTMASDGNVFPRRIYKYIDRSFPANFWGQSIGIELRPTTPIRLRLYEDVFTSCGLASGLKNYETIECMKLVMGQAIDAVSLQDAGPVRSFYNSYLGGSWNLYIPSTGWDEFLNQVQNVRVHYFFKKRSSVN